MAANVTYIPPKAAKPEALRVAAYCRVSSCLLYTSDAADD